MKATVRITGRIFVEVMYSDEVEVDITDDMTDEDIKEEAKNVSMVGQRVSAIVNDLESEHDDIIDQIDINDGDEDADIESIDEINSDDSEN